MNLPEVIDNPPERYDNLEQHHGVVSQKVNLLFDGQVYRLTVKHVVIELDWYLDEGDWNEAVERYRENYSLEEHDIDEVSKTLSQSIAFYKQYESEYEKVDWLNGDYSF